MQIPTSLTKATVAGFLKVMTNLRGLWSVRRRSGTVALAASSVVELASTAASSLTMRRRLYSKSWLTVAAFLTRLLTMTGVTTEFVGTVGSFNGVCGA